MLLRRDDEHRLEPQREDQEEEEGKATRDDAAQEFDHSFSENCRQGSLEHAAMYLIGLAFSEVARGVSPETHDEPHPAGSDAGPRSEEHTSELPSLMRISYAVSCLKNKKYI